MIDLPKFNNPGLLKQAFVHRSFLNESREKISSNERMEFLGDSILSFVVSKYLYEKYPDFEEGILTNLRALLVNTKSLAEIARELNFGKLLTLSKGEEESKGRQNQTILANCFEAFIGALFIDSGIDKVTDFISKALLPKADEYVKSKSFKDPKSLLQEKVQAQKQASPLYKVLEEKGPAHAKTFKVGAYMGDELLGQGEGRSKQQAEEEAAKASLIKLSGLLRKK
ncbi:MAG TPA: ribonuclease III [Patescibacteria group bacterium]|nr:ribonuclease III [Patescibacteria group bacterium]